MKGHVDEIQPKESNCVIKMEQQIWYKAFFIERVKGKRGKPHHGWITEWACQAQALSQVFCTVYASATVSPVKLRKPGKQCTKHNNVTL